MANKNLVKRAFSVTANLPSQRKVDATEGAVQLDGAVTAGEPPNRLVEQVAPAPMPTPITAPRTGPGSMLAFMTEQSEVHREVVQLRERVSEFDGAQVAKRIDPAQIVASKWANRDESHFRTPAFARLKDEIASAGGNVQPIKLRPLAGAEPGKPHLEIVYGHRRHRACLELGLPVLALIQNHMGDSELFVEMERENREREDLSAWEQGVMYMRALEQGLFPSAKQLAAAIDRDMSNISRAMALAKLPADVVRAFGSPLNLQFRWATPLKDAHQKDPEGLLQTSRELLARDQKPSPAEVFAILTRKGDGRAAGPGAAIEWKDEEGKRAASLTTDRKSRVTLSFDHAMDEAQRRKLVKLIDAFLGMKS
ncbi:ParB/RepB/Spo0J family partition protein [Variovorax sp. OV329]|uniref:ParB/RepB/Spo0J family partition protein n=1 Tax=Variovorax sp. OV329 TaxID=1882825 RepID=UPI0008EF4C93|nr:ParB/RepB/Spo0J family partition protein [Variovorax sp. OV329]SFM91950.1 chromosome partitioning protein, ParB family [Variovorax sp. OV329]